MKIDSNETLIFGAGGQVGNRLRGLLPNAVALDRDQVDFTQLETISEVLEEYKPKIVINAAAYTAVDLAEKEPEIAHLVNAEAPGRISEWCCANKAIFVHYSTDYVFPGKGMEGSVENTAPGPINEYGKSKLEGEKLVVKHFYKQGLDKGRFFIFRTSWVYDSLGKNFLLTMLKLGAEKETLNIVSDQIGAPTYAKDIAEKTIAAVTRAMDKDPFPSGVYHFCQAGETSWFLFAEEIFTLARDKGFDIKVKTVNPIRTEEYPAPAKRPMNSRMDCSKLETRLDLKFRNWKVALNECIEDLYTRYHTS
ncbi:MAG: dTDP-4-dehydrorhamnose reductase [Xanthomonadaceae bacterium]|nr:dTDP-4-dehydrorhamnose reductase [Xanthomonadaceae bacterium]